MQAFQKKVGSLQMSKLLRTVSAGTSSGKFLPIIRVELVRNDISVTSIGGLLSSLSVLFVFGLEKKQRLFVFEIKNQQRIFVVMFEQKLFQGSLVDVDAFFWYYDR